MAHAYLVRYGQAAAVGRFLSDLPHDRGARVVVRSHRGLELGEVLVEAPDDFPGAGPGETDEPTRIVRPATSDDLARADAADRRRDACFDACARLLDDLPGRPALDLIDVELLLDDRRAVLHYLGPHHLPGLTSWLTTFRERLDLEVMFAAVGLDADEPTEADGHDHDDAHGCGSCSTAGGCGSGGCGTSGSCSDCGVMKAMAARTGV